jgi:hypothetical protein
MAPSLFGLMLGLTFWGVESAQLAAADQPYDDGCVSVCDVGDDDCHAQYDRVTINNVSSGTLRNGDQKWKWDPSKTHPCNIRRISRLQLLNLFGNAGLPKLYPFPLIIHPDRGNENSWFANLTTLDNLPLNFPPDFHVTLSGSDSLSSHRRIIPLKQYLREILTANNCSGETLPNQLGNETWYLFGETFSHQWTTFLQSYELPPCETCTQFHRLQGLVALSFGIGNTGSGVQWHLHGPGFSETIHGRKHWVLYPPTHRPEYDLNYASRHWMENIYPALEDWTDDDFINDKKGHHGFLQRWKRNKIHVETEESAMPEKKHSPSSKKPWECTVNAGEMIYFPDSWHHATINLEKYTVFVSSFTTEY